MRWAESRRLPMPASPRFKVVIPARFGSSRLPGKPLLPIAGRPMIARVCERALATGAEEIVVAVDDERIAEAVRDLPVRALLTGTDHASGTERLVEVAQRLGWDDSVLVVNLQGDEPLIDPELVCRLATAFAQQDGAQVATLAAPISHPDELFAPSAVKVVLDRNGYALYFSRAPIPWYRDGFDRATRLLPEGFGYLRHIGMYAYTAGFLRRYATWPVSPLEQIESLEQLRILWCGERIFVLPVDSAPEAGVDTPADLERVEQAIATDVASDR
jgi:3-deoxy-manno-octulosonate cytidylyltransferase (CMP-KDO synthetase)